MQRQVPGIIQELFCALSSEEQIIQMIELGKQSYLLKENWNSVDNLLKLAIDRGFEQVVQKLIELKANLNREYDVYGSTALFFAVQGGKTGIVRQLVDAKADINKTDIYGVTGLHKAAFEGDLEIVRLLVEKKADVHKITTTRDSSLLSAISRHHVNIAQYLMEEAGAQFDDSALDSVITHRNLDMIWLVIKKFGLDTLLNKDLTPNLLIVLFKLFEQQKKLRNQGSEQKGEMRLAESEYRKLEKVIAKANLNIKNSRGQTALILAMVTTSFIPAEKDIVCCLVDAKADVNIISLSKETALAKAVLLDSADCQEVCYLLDAKADVNGRGDLLDYYAHRKKNIGMTYQVLKAGASIKDPKKLYAWLNRYYDAYYSEQDVVSLLLGIASILIQQQKNLRDMPGSSRDVMLEDSVYQELVATYRPLCERMYQERFQKLDEGTQLPNVLRSMILEYDLPGLFFGANANKAKQVKERLEPKKPKI